ncbi:ShlB/FhaC/HecB family hemolysin secretion/activation protein [[Mannheimia] succiniciproducens]|uniref:FhaC protein n=1 Tax=Mannheimia succiniciproducens (strain KCTC 0769BP / MBEL55E) TaxID=221988 RepID=Q65TD4_MANSM|nr:ShlB/FhaC/HecB family hemolysin secretion/activation protein [[Mannheimia] succiniciproducens]AAU37776.1 FhaC protein [[Mannheimia] succiniciproducens MBEL55E]
MRVFTGVILSLCSACVLAVDSPNLNQLNVQSDAALQQRQEEQNKALQRQQVADPNIRLENRLEPSEGFPEKENPCYQISHIILTDFSPEISDFSVIPPSSIPSSRFYWALNAIYSTRDFSLPHCLGSEGINILLKRIQNRLIEQGYITTRVVVQPQNLQNGILVITVIPGKIGQIQLQDESSFPYATSATLWFAMPTNNGEILNLRHLEQGLENLKRNTSADANMQLSAVEDEVGASDVIIRYKQGFPIHLTLGLDDSGTKATGRLQGTATLSWDNMFSLNDLFYASFTKSIKRHSDNVDEPHGSKNVSLYYSVPWKNWLLTLSGYQYRYHQSIAGAFENYQYSGKSTQLRMNLSYLLYRNSSRKSYISFGGWARKSFNYINDVEVEVQRRRMAGWDIGLKHIEYLGDATLQISANYKRGTGAYKALPAPEEYFDEGTSRPQIITVGIDLNYPFNIGEQPWKFNTSWNAQWNQTPLIQQDKFSIGGRYTVRGFDGELYLSGERGWLWRNELAWNVFNKGQELYLGIDKGNVYSRFDDLPGNSLVGGAIGLRGKIWGLDYDYFVGVPIDKPAGFKTSHVTTGFNLNYRF